MERDMQFLYNLLFDKYSGVFDVSKTGNGVIRIQIIREYYDSQEDIVFNIGNDNVSYYISERKDWI